MSARMRQKLSLAIAVLIMASALSLGASMPVHASAVFAGGNGADWNPYQIKTVRQLAAMSQRPDLHYILVNDLDATTYLAEGGEGWNDGAGWLPVGDGTSPFSGSFDGKGHTITGLRINRNTDGLGMFGYVSEEAVIRNIRLQNVNVSGTAGLMGSLAGVNRGTIENVASEGAVASSLLMYTGGLVGSNTGLIRYAQAAVDTTGDMAAGGLVGNNEGTITDSFAAGAITGGSNNTFGGLVGNATTNSDITRSYATGNVTSASSNAGGLVGFNQGSISQAYAAGNITGNVTSGNNIGGLVGTLQGSVTDAYATGSVSGAYGVGGLVGYGGTITNAYATGSVSGISMVGGIAGGGAAVTASYYNSDTAGQLDAEQGEAKSTAELQSAATFADWNWDTLWSIDEGSSYPALQMQDESAPWIVRATVEDASPNQVVLLFNKAVTAADASGISIRVQDLEASIVGTDFDTAAHSVTLTLDAPVTFGQRATIAYNGAGTLADLGSRSLDGFTESILNRVGKRISFDVNGGSSVDPILAAAGSTAAAPVAPARAGYRFAGWYTEEQLSEPWDFATDLVQTDMILYAKWVSPPQLVLDNSSGSAETFLDTPLSLSLGEDIVAIEFTLTASSNLIQFQTDSSELAHAFINYIGEDEQEQYRIVIGSAEQSVLPEQLGYFKWRIAREVSYQQPMQITLSNILVSDSAGATTAIADVEATVTIDDTAAPTLTLTSSTWPNLATSVDIIVAADGTGGDIAQLKWAEGEKDPAWFKSEGSIIAGNSVGITANGLYTFYAEDEAGNAAVQTIEVGNYVVKGDVNFDASPYFVDITDWQLLANYILFEDAPDDRQLFAADMNNDGDINVGDWVLLAKLLLQ
ncbi:GLUG motif-containing protein [Paenibacillus sp. HB172176]|uniref:GLUG motif-containing protein n=1 Tax=Paenibacillus sp. HB172176 TaxID=2493690 RepID=UPI001438A584|nr:GLUG motif-containing protein [Paenibacillus sp. HB172176]